MPRQLTPSPDDDDDDDDANIADTLPGHTHENAKDIFLKTGLTNLFIQQTKQPTQQTNQTCKAIGCDFLRVLEGGFTIAFEACEVVCLVR